MTLHQALDFFLLDQQLRGNSDKTIHGYKGFLKRLLAYLANAGVENVGDLTLQHVNRYQLHLGTKPCERGRNEQLTKKSIQTYMRHIKVFLTYLHTEGFIMEPVHLKVKLPKAERTMFRILTWQEISEVFSCFKKDVLGLRNTAIISLLLDCGLRRAELTRVKIEHINFKKCYLLVIGKGGKERLVPLGNKVRASLAKYLCCGRREAVLTKDNEYLFLTAKGKPMTVHCISSLMCRLKKLTGIPRLNAHLFRHTFATNFLVHGLGDIYELSRLLGHTELKTTEQYLQIASYYTIMENRQSYSFLDKQKSPATGLYI